MDVMPPHASTTKAISYAKTKTTIVLIAVPKSELTFLIPTFDKTAVIPAKNADNSANITHIKISLSTALTRLK